MTFNAMDVDDPRYEKQNLKTIIHQWRRESGRTVLILASLAVVVIAGWLLYNRPAHIYAVNANQATWRADVKIALKERPPMGPLTPSGRLQSLPGVGPLMSVYVYETNAGKNVSVLFLTNVGQEENGLAYLQGFPPPSDTCNVHLSGPWWQISPLNINANECARGYHYTPGG
jgi:hypothetical protein